MKIIFSIVALVASVSVLVGKIKMPEELTGALALYAIHLAFVAIQAAGAKRP